MRVIWCVVGFLSLFLGTIGIVLPILPTVPFYMLTVFAFAKSSGKLHQWFLSTGLYKKHLASFAREKAMTRKSKGMVLITVTILMAAGFICMRHILIGRICLFVVWAGHMIYFLGLVKTIR